MAMTPAERIRLGLDDPPAEPPDEFSPMLPPANLPAATATPNLKLMLREGEKASAPKLRQLVNELLAENLQGADLALKQLFAANPKLGLEAYVELAKFSLPQLKAVAVDFNDRSDNPRSMSTQQLMQVLQGD